MLRRAIAILTRAAPAGKSRPPAPPGSDALAGGKAPHTFPECV
jgi:hypothetical protein